MDTVYKQLFKESLDMETTDEETTDNPEPRKRKTNSSVPSSPVRERDSCKGNKRWRHVVPNSDSPSSSDDKDFEIQRKKRNLRSFQKSDLKGVDKNTTKAGASLAGVEQMQIDAVQFDGVGGLSEHISSLKEMVIFPLLYPEIFERLKIEPPRGCLFYGPPGTGKTLLARALANECSQGDMRVTFFMRKGAECLSKWIGESERQLRLLFEQAYQMRPSIIFFDEIDALAPVRSGKQDQVHSSIVGTLLTLMDGLDSRGEIVVIGATNRLDSIDPALRRPGRFEREFRFNLPNKEARKEIFKIHTRDWNPKPSDNLLEELAEECVGYCGADIKALCAETGLCALRDRYPQLYESRERLQINMDLIKIKANYFSMAMQKTVPASQRTVPSPGRALSAISKPLLKNTLERILQALQRVFPHAELALKKDQQQGNYVIDSDEESPSVSEEKPTHKTSDHKKAEICTFSRNPCDQPTSYRPRFLLVEEPESGQAYDLAAAVIHSLENFPIYTLDTPTLFVCTSPDERCIQLMREAQRTAPSIIYIPQIPSWWESVGPTLKSVFTTLLQNIPRFTPVLLLATSDVQHRDLPEEIKALFNNEYEEVFKIPRPTCAERRHFFEDLIMKQAAQPPASKNNTAWQPLEVLPIAPPPKPRQLTEEELRQVKEEEEDTLRELRIYLRDVAHRLVVDRRFRPFMKPVDPEEAPNYKAVIKQPMDLSTVLSKIDMHQYLTAEDFLKDIDLICSNALQYNSYKSPEDGLLSHKAYALSDTAYSIVRHELDKDFEQRCQEIKESRKERGCKKTVPKCNEKMEMPAVPVDASTPCSNEKSKRKHKTKEDSSSIAAQMKNPSQDTPVEEHENVLQGQQKTGTENERDKVTLVAESSTERKSVILSEHSDIRKASGMPDWQKAGTSEDGHSNDSQVHHTNCVGCSQVDEQPQVCDGKAMKIHTQEVSVDYSELKQVLDSIIVATENVSMSCMERLYAVLSQCIYQHREDDDKTELVRAMKKEIATLSCL
ncbi:ATPase family AAA domain-containing protein 2-like isoform X1 [Empidonax traillii]|uniref:ATPase family AAA domain-containing protein 2-like isoform X1 n=1 Tax=Empidonax traillii TaxID=164674 RepID=UPI000FFD5EDD|nr:ATPase family AAA domain-containing protein 2-like isoform X1 [Empidonax traillii]